MEYKFFLLPPNTVLGGGDRGLPNFVGWGKHYASSLLAPYTPHRTNDLVLHSFMNEWG
jgi:hypothetical protein